MAYKQINNPFPVTSCGRRRTFTQGGNPGNDRQKTSRFKKSGPPRTKPHASWTQKDRDKYNKETSSNLKPPQPGGGSRRDSYCARSAGIKKCKNPDKNGDCPNDIARRKWNC
jgi:hypothetical protein